MVGGIDRYYQIARCLRDEDLRADRQYEFMQLDVEMSFVTQDDVLAAISEAVLAAAEAVTGERPPTIERITWHEAMDRFGIDKPDLRFGMELVELTDVFAATEFKAFAGAGAIKGIRVPGGADEYGRNQLDELTDRAKRSGAKGLVWMRVAADGTASTRRSPSSSPRRAAGAASTPSDAEPGDLMLIVADEWTTTLRGARHAAQRPRPPAGARGPVPLRVGRRLPAVRRRRRGRAPEARPPPVHPAAPRRRRPARVRPAARCARRPTTSCSTAGSSAPARSGSTSPTSSGACSTLLGISDEEAERKFGFFLDPFGYGAPPHGGFAFGIDRLVAILAGEENIREVIAFPKTQSGTDPMTNAPTPATSRRSPSSASRSCLLPPDRAVAGACDER